MMNTPILTLSLYMSGCVWMYSHRRGANDDAAVLENVCMEKAASRLYREERELEEWIDVGGEGGEA